MRGVVSLPRQCEAEGPCLSTPVSVGKEEGEISSYFCTENVTADVLRSYGKLWSVCLIYLMLFCLCV